MSRIIIDAPSSGVNGAAADSVVAAPSRFSARRQIDRNAAVLAALDMEQARTENFLLRLTVRIAALRTEQAWLARFA